MCIHQEKGRREHNHEPGHSIVPKRVLNRAVPGPSCAGTCAAKSLQYVPVEGHACVTSFSYYSWILTGHPFSCLYPILWGLFLPRRLLGRGDGVCGVKGQQGLRFEDIRRDATMEL